MCNNVNKDVCQDFNRTFCGDEGQETPSCSTNSQDDLNLTFCNSSSTGNPSRICDGNNSPHDPNCTFKGETHQDRTFCANDISTDPDEISCPSENEVFDTLNSDNDVSHEKSTKTLQTDNVHCNNEANQSLLHSEAESVDGLKEPLAEESLSDEHLPTEAEREWEDCRSERDDKAQEKIDRDLGRTFKCPFKTCSSSFTNINGLRKHKSAIHAPPIKCKFPGCLKKVKKTNMGQHLIGHTKEPKCCKDCGMDFTAWKNDCIKNHPKKCTKERRTLVRRSSQKKSKK